MQVNLLFLILSPVAEKFSEMLLEFLLTKFLEWSLSDDNLKHLSTTLKLQLLLLYLDWLLQKTALKELPNTDLGCLESQVLESHDHAEFTSQNS